MSRPAGVWLAALLALSWSLGWTGSADARPQFVRLSLTGDGADQMTVTWNTTDENGSQVRYGTAPGEWEHTVEGSAFRATGELGFVHEVTLEGLEPSTTYYYIAGDETDGFSSEFEFTTAPTEKLIFGHFPMYLKFFQTCDNGKK